MDYKTKYLKYKNKYLILRSQIGGYYKTTQTFIFGNVQPDTLSSIYMPVILAPFDNIDVIFPDRLDLELRSINLGGLNAPIFLDIINRVKNFYRRLGIDTTSSYNMNLYQFDYPPFHMTGGDQERLLKDAGVKDDLDFLIGLLYYPEHNHKFSNMIITTQIKGDIDRII